MNDTIGPLIAGVVVVIAAFAVLIVVKVRMKKDSEDKPAEMVEMEMQELIERAKADMEVGETEEAGPELKEGRDE